MPTMDLNEAKKVLDDAKMRLGLLQFLWQFTTDANNKIPRPCPPMNDNHVSEELKRILS